MAVRRWDAYDTWYPSQDGLLGFSEYYYGPYSFSYKFYHLITDDPEILLHVASMRSVV
jgi:hypothetical protein